MTTSFSTTTVSPGTSTVFTTSLLDHHFHGHFDRLDDLFFDDDRLAWDFYSLYHLFFDDDSLAWDLYLLHHLFDYFHGHFEPF